LNDRHYPAAMLGKEVLTQTGLDAVAPNGFMESETPDGKPFSASTLQKQLMKDPQRIAIGARDDHNPLPLCQPDVVSALVRQRGQQAFQPSVPVHRNSHHVNGLQNPKQALFLDSLITHARQGIMHLHPFFRHSRVGLDKEDALLTGHLPQSRSKLLDLLSLAPVKHRATRHIE
jgi:hypothetical protein